MIKKKKVLIFIDWFYPAHKAGGPIRSVYNLIMALSAEIDFLVVTSAYDIGETNPLEGVTLNTWVNNDDYAIIYLEKSNQTIKHYKEIVELHQPDFLYLNSLFSIGFTLKPILSNSLKVKTVLAPRGMLKQDALAIKPLKKRLFLSLMRSTGFMNSIKWHASSDVEGEEVYAHFGNTSEVEVAQNLALTSPSRPESTIIKGKGQLRLVFFSRISPIKNLDFLLKVLDSIKNLAISLDIYGPIEDKEYWASCEKLIAANKLNVTYNGVLGQFEKEKILWEYDYMILPTKGENFGHAIAESLCPSLPVIISQNTPWRDLEDHNVGYDLPLQMEDFSNVISKLVDESLKEYQMKVEAAFKYSNEHIIHKSVIEQNRKLFNE